MYAIALGGSILLASVSYFVLEQPVRRSGFLDRYRIPTIAVGFATSILIGLLVMPSVLDSGTKVIVGADGRAIDWRAAKRDIPDLPDCLAKPVAACTVVRGGGRRVPG